VAVRRRRRRERKPSEGPFDLFLLRSVGALEPSMFGTRSSILPEASDIYHATLLGSLAVEEKGSLSRIIAESGRCKAKDLDSALRDSRRSTSRVGSITFAPGCDGTAVGLGTKRSRPTERTESREGKLNLETAKCEGSRAQSCSEHRTSSDV
jgi:hypothetical protein